MKCDICGSTLHHSITDLPFKVGQHAILVIKDLPVMQCEGCREYLIEDKVMERVDRLLQAVDKSAELEVVKFAA